MKNGTKLLVAMTAVIGLALVSVIPALAQEDDRPTTASADCPYHEEMPMTDREMNWWMESAGHEEWMGSAGHDRMHAAMADHMRENPRMGTDSMMGRMSGPGYMMGSSG